MIFWPYFIGFDVTYDLRQEVNSRVTRLLIRCADCVTKNKFVPIEPQKIYDVVMAKYLADGGDGYKMILEQKLDDFVGKIIPSNLQNLCIQSRELSQN